MPSKQQFSLYLLQIFFLAGLVYTFVLNFWLWGENQFIYLAHSFLDGKLYFTTLASRLEDTSLYQGHYFWPEGPLPAVLLVPFVAVLGLNMHQGYLQFFLTLLNCFLIYKIAFRITQNQLTSLWLSFGFIFGSVYLATALVPWSYFFAQVVATSCLLLAVLEFLGKRRWLLIGACLGLAVATRLSLLFGSVFFILSLLTTPNTNRVKIRQLAHLLSPLVLVLSFLGLYNLARFNNPMEFGYHFHNPSALATVAPLRTYGAWNLIYYPANLYYLFLSTPKPVFLANTKILIPPFVKPDVWGTSILLTSPWLLIMLKAPWKKPLVRYSAIASFATLLFILGYFGIGGRQYGYRYALDIYPFLLIITSYALKGGVNYWVRAGIVYSFFFALVMIPLVFRQPINP